MSTNKKVVVVNGKAEDPITKKKLPLSVDWQKIAREKQAAEKGGGK